MTLPIDQPKPRPDFARPALRFARAALLLSCLASGAAQAQAQEGPTRVFDATSFKTGTMWQLGVTEESSRDTGCAAQYALSELAGDGEHTVYQHAELSGEAVLRLRIKAAQRYGVQVGFASLDWMSFSAASVSLISGAYQVMDGGSLKAVRASAEPRSDGWVEINLSVVDRDDARRSRSAAGYAFVKLTADGGYKEYRGRPGLGVELCAISQ